MLDINAYKEIQLIICFLATGQSRDPGNFQRK